MFVRKMGAAAAVSRLFIGNVPKFKSLLTYVNLSYGVHSAGVAHLVHGWVQRQRVLWLGIQSFCLNKCSPYGLFISGDICIMMLCNHQTNMYRDESWRDSGMQTYHPSSENKNKSTSDR